MINLTSCFLQLDVIGCHLVLYEVKPTHMGRTSNCALEGNSKSIVLKFVCC